MTENKGNALVSKFESFIQWGKKKWRKRILFPSLVVLVSFILTIDRSFIWNVLVASTCRLLLTIIGTAIGVGFGLGLAIHVYEQLEDMVYRRDHCVDEVMNGDSSKGNFLTSLKKPSLLPTSSCNVWTGEESAYASLMNNAGYDVSDQFLRGQVIRKSSKFFDLNYPFTDEPDVNKWKSVLLMREQWPTLPDKVTLELGKFMEYVMRDFVGSWYRYIDAGIVYEDEREKRRRQLEVNEEKKDECKKRKNEAKVITEKKDEQNEKTSMDHVETSENYCKVMIFSTALHRSAPMMTAVYQSLGIVFGNLSTRIEGVNFFSLLLLKWTKVLSHSFRVYRRVRKGILEKHPSTKKNLRRKHKLRGNVKQDIPAEEIPYEESGIEATATCISEMSIVREFMKKGKLHRAITFGMDVPSLVFGDAKGDEYGVPDMNNTSSATGKDISMTEDEVLEKRLFDGKLLHECEMDYNRVLGNRLIRALLPRAEFSSPVIRMSMTELLAGCILTPLMGTFVPESINDWILMGCEESSENEDSRKGKKDGEKEEFKMQKEEELGQDDSFLKNSESLSSFSKIVEENTTESNGETNSSKEPEKQNFNNGVEMTMSQANLITSGSDGVEMIASQTDFFKNGEEKALLNDLSDDGVNISGEHGMSLQLQTDEDEDSFSHEISNNFEEGDEPIEIEHVDVAGQMNSFSSSDDSEEDCEATTLAEVKPLPTADFVLPLLTMSLIDLQRFIDFEEWRDAQQQKIDVDVKWEDPEMQEAITQLVLVIEAALLHGRRKFKLEEEKKDKLVDGAMNVDEDEKGIEVAIAPSSLAKTLMEITSDPDEFEDKILQEEEEYIDDKEQNEQRNGPIEFWEPSSPALSTLRSLLAAWLHTGQAHRIMSVFIGAQHTILKPFFYQHAFIRNRESAEGFVRQLRQLNGVHIYVDTLTLLSAPSMDVNEDGKTAIPKPDAKARLQESLALSAAIERSPSRPEKGEASKLNLRARFNLRGVHGENNSESDLSLSIVQPSGQVMTLPQAYVSSSGLPRFIDFRRNENFASSLRAERDRRTNSWANSTRNSKGLQIISKRKGSSEVAIGSHREMHHVSRIFYAGTNIIALRTGARRKDSEGTTDKSDGSDVVSVSLLTVEMACQRRRLEVPDDDSSFLLRAQPRPLNAIGVHRDQRNHNMSFKSFAATYEEPAFRQGQSRYAGGRYIRKCLLRYHPNDRTTKVVISTDGRCLDQRKELGVPKNININEQSSTTFLSSDFLRERHLCQKWTPKGATPRSGSILASSVMEITDFNAVPRSGKAIDFVFRMSLFERPMVELGGKRFTVHDSTTVGPHRADASSLEMSDAALSMVLLTIGDEWEEQVEDVGTDIPKARLLRSSSIEMGIDGYPIIWMKYARKQGENNVTEVKSYRTSFVRAALMVTSARQDAQLQCLMKCVKAGSARSATKQRTEAYLQPTARLLEYANSSEREKQSILLRDLKLGMNHIDKGQLTRNGLLSPRFPTELRGLIAKCEGAAQVKDNTALSMPGIVAPSVTMYKIRCCALVSLSDIDLDGEDLTSFMSPDGSISEFFREEWVIYRPMKDIQLFHKHLKTQVAAAEQSASAGARLVGAATAAFTVNGQHGSNRRRKAMIPSLGNAQKGGGLGMSKKSIQKRCGIINEYFQYLLSDDHPLNRCSELLMFLGAFYPFPSDVASGGDAVTNKSDPLGRLEMKREVFDVLNKTEKSLSSTVDEGNITSTNHQNREDLLLRSTKSEGIIDNPTKSIKSMNEYSRSLSKDEFGTDEKQRVKEIDMIPSIKAKIDEVPLVKVRSALFELLRYQFDFDNANFFRNRMFSALKTMSFAVASSGEFRKMLYETHIKYLNADALADWIKFASEMLFPNGVFCEFSPPTPEEETIRKAERSKEVLLKVFPDQISSVLGPEMVNNGLHMLHEMLQNRVILKSMSYMLFDLLWLEIFPELHDILTGPAALESEY